jgi:hypothetical protein
VRELKLNAMKEERKNEITEHTIEIALEAARKYNVNHIVFASKYGDSAEMILNLGDNEIHFVCVRTVFGTYKPGENAMRDDIFERIKNSDIDLVTGTHVLSGAERGLSKKFNGIYPVEIIANTLRMFGQGVKVCVEISSMALDAGAIPFGEAIIVLAGNTKGLDTAILITPSYTANILDTKIHNIIVKGEFV